MCELCDGPGGKLLWQNRECRVILVPDPDYPGFCRIIWNEHVREMTDLGIAQRQRLMEVVFAVEQAVRACLSPDKINLASLGNVVPHLHWHVVPRFRDDRHFPNPVWSTPLRPNSRSAPPDIFEYLKDFLVQHLSC